MKKLLLAITLCLATATWSQWTSKTISNGFDEPFKKAYTETNNSGWLAMEVGYEESEVLNPKDSTTEMVTLPLLYLHGSYFCEDSPVVDFVFVTKLGDKRWSIQGSKSSDNDLIFFPSDLFSNQEFKTDFMTATQIKVRVNETYCQTEIYQFSGSGSTAAYNFIMKK